MLNLQLLELSPHTIYQLFDVFSLLLERLHILLVLGLELRLEFAHQGVLPR